MLESPRHRASNGRSFELRPNDLKIVALFALVALAFVFFVSSKIEMPGDPEYPTMFYGL